MIDRKDIAISIKERMTIAGISASKLSRLTGIHRNTVQGHLTKGPSFIDDLCKYAEALNCKVSDLLNEPSSHKETFDNKCIAINIKERMAISDISASKMSRLTGIHKTTLNNHLTKGPAFIDDLYKYAEALNCKVSDLLKDPGSGKKTFDESYILNIWPYNLILDVIYYNCKKPDDKEEQLKSVREVYIPGFLECVDKLIERERLVLDMRYKDNFTLDKIGEEFRVTRERIRQIIGKALRKLGHPSFRSKYILRTKEEYDTLKRNYEALKFTHDNMIRTIRKKSDIFTPDFSDSIDVLGLTVRSSNCLHRAGIDTVNDLTKLSYNDLIRVRNLGRRSVEEIQDKLKSYLNENNSQNNLCS